MKAGELRNLVTLQSPYTSRDDGGQFLISEWIDVRTCWAKIEPLAGREYQDDAAVTGEIQHRVTLRWKPDWSVNSSWRLLYGTRVLEIDSVINIDERGRMAVLLCRETM